MKTCLCCDQLLPPRAFRRVRTSPGRLHTFCKQCLIDRPDLPRNPHKDCARCSECGKRRRLLQFPDLDGLRICLVCDPDACVTGNAALE